MFFIEWDIIKLCLPTNYAQCPWLNINKHIDDISDHYLPALEFNNPCDFVSLDFNNNKNYQNL